MYRLRLLFLYTDENINSLLLTPTLLPQKLWFGHPPWKVKDVGSELIKGKKESCIPAYWQVS